MRVRIKRVYDPPAGADGRRILVDRLWPRGLTKEAARIDLWLRDVAPSAALRTWFGHDPARWKGFLERYARELDANPEGVAALREALRGRATLVYGARDPEHNQAVAIGWYLARRKPRS